MSQQAALLGIPQEAVERDSPLPPEVVEVAPCNWTAVQLFLHCETQWRADGRGLDYAAVLSVAGRMMQIPDGAELVDVMDRLKVIEIEIMNHQAKTHGKP